MAKVRKAKTIKTGMPNFNAEDYHFPKKDHNCTMKAELWVQMMDEKGFKIR